MMSVKLSRKKVVLCCLLTAILFVLANGCMSPDEYKADADKEVYKVIEDKWEGSFGERTNYKISDSEPSPNDIQTPNPAGISGVLALAEAAAIATANNRDYQQQKESLYGEALRLTGTRHQYAIQWFGAIDGKYTDDKGSGYEEFKVGGEGDEIGVSDEEVFSNGVLFSTNLALNWARFLTGDPRNTLGSVLSGDITVPLLGNGAGKQAWETLTQAERSMLYQIRTFNRYRKTFVVGIINAYYGVLQRRDSVINARNNLARKQDSTKRLEMEAEWGRKAQLDVDEAKQSELSAQNQYVAAQRGYESALDNFKVKQLSLPTDANISLDPNELKALEEIKIGKPDFTLEASIDTGLTQRLDLANTYDKIDDAVRNLELASEGLGPQVNISGSINVNSRADTDFSQLQFQEGSYSTGFGADLPFDQKDERNSYRSALITLTQAQRSYDKARDNIELTIKDDYRQVLETAERYRIQKMSLGLAQSRVRNNEMMLEIGRGTVRQLLLSQDALLDAQNAVISALISHTMKKLNFYTNVGVLQVRPDGMWEIKAK